MISEALKTLEKKLKDINKASMRKVRFHSDQNKLSLKKQEHSMPRFDNKRKEAKKLMKKSNETEGVYALKLFDTLVTPSSKYGVKI